MKCQTLVFPQKVRTVETWNIADPRTVTGTRVKTSTRSTALRSRIIQVLEQQVGSCQQSCFRRDVWKYVITKQRLYPKGRGKAKEVKETADPTKLLSKGDYSCIYLSDITSKHFQ